MASSSKTTKDHDEIRNWVEERGGKPAHVSSTGSKDDIGILRIEFPSAPGSNDSNLEELSWDQFFEKFDERGLALLFQEETASGERSNFNKLVSSETAEETEERASSHSANGRGSRKSAPKKATAKKAIAKKAQAGLGGGQAKKAAALKKTGTAKKAAPAKKGAAKKSAPTKKRAPVKKSAPAKKNAPAKKGAAPGRPAKKTAAKKGASTAARKKVAAPAKKAAKGTASKRTTAKKSSGRGRR